jgi:TonB family protein
VFLDTLQSGFVLFETREGLVRVDLSFWQRVYLLWTFRNFRQLSTRLMNARQCALVNALFRNGATAASHQYDPLLVIGVVEEFVPPTSQIRKKERQEEVVAPRMEAAPSRRGQTAAQKIVFQQLAGSAPAIAWSKLGTTLAALSLCVISAVAWHRLQGIPGSQAHNQPRPQLTNATTSPNSPPPETPVTVAQSPTAIAPSAATAGPFAVPKATVKSAPIAAVIPTPKQPPRVQAGPATPSLPLSGQDSRILASRPPLRFVYPIYPDVRTRGVVALTARVDSEGTVHAVRIVSGNRALAAAAVQAVRQWRYRPYLKDGQPVATETNIVISFISDDAISMSFPPSLPLAEPQPAKNPSPFREESKMR